MISKNHLNFIFAFLIIRVVFAQNFVGDFENILNQKESELTIKTTNSTINIQFCSPTIVRFRTSWTGVFEERDTLMISNYNWTPVKYNLEESSNEIKLTTLQLDVRINKNPFTFQIFDKNGELLSSEIADSNYSMGAYKQNQMVGTQKRLHADEHFFGFGERMDFLDRRGKKLRLNVGRGIGRPHIIGAYNVLEANYSPVPFFMSTKGYGIFFHNAYPTNWDMGHTNSNTYSFEAEGGELDYFLIYGPTFPEILNGYTSITGKSPLLPKFAFGLHVGTYSGGTWGHEELTSGDYVVKLAETFRDLQIPLDVLHLDSTWRIFGENGGKGATSFEWRETFTNPEKMFDDLYKLNLNMVGLHLRPRFDNGKTLRLLDKAREKGFVYPEEDNPGEFVNFFDQNAVDWWWNNGVMRVAEQGAMFLKTDEGSAFGHKANESEKIGPQGEEIKKLHNLFPLVYAKAPYEKFQEYNGIRGMNQTREGYAGIQRYPYIFAGDWPSEWQYFEPVIKAGLNIGLSGVGYWTHCMGGFEHVADPELYIRWTQFGLMSPIAHLFGMEHPNYKEPWNYGEEAQAIFKQYDELRYSLIPYLYSTAYDMYKTGKPIMRALVMDYQNDQNVYDITNQYMLGAYLMVCPVTEKGAQTRVVYLPEGNWINYWTGESLEGKKHYNVLCPLDQMPIFIKAGAIIPSQEVVNYVGEKTITTLDLAIYPSTNSKFTVYDDDGKSLNYQNGTFISREITVEMNTSNLSITVDAPKGNFESKIKNYNLQIHLGNKPKSIEINKELFLIGQDANNAGQILYRDSILSIPIELSNNSLQISIKK
ncbi:glycoside hydrolase family 31 protein [Aegicerativicinus sediminis]|uniref:glycoside hydrolase family 31 protein n=1 Tax=Aegicerativicinus sediminis TaxID=2893202 RepID=UPI001E333BC1|nr:TIM-barrel domain-containing protein [Aegicerativicinus sediminis]